MKNFDQFVNEILSNIPTKTTETSDVEILRAGILAEMDAINVYEQMSNVAKNPKIKKLLLDIAKEEKTHVGEFQVLLKEIDSEFEQELKNGNKELNKLQKEKED
jgi:rubrerythrin